MELFAESFKEDHILSGIDARIKLLVALAILIMILSYKGFVLPLLVLTICMFFCIKMKMPARVFLVRLSEPAFIAIMILILKLFSPGNNVMFTVNVIGFKISGYTDRLMEGLMISSRIFSAVSIVAVMGFSTPFAEFMAGLSWLRVPKSFIEISMFAYRYIFVLIEDAIVIYNAQKNRLGYSSMRRGLSSFGVLSGSLILKAFERSHNATAAMIQRGYDGTMPMLKHKPFRLSEILGSILFVIVLVVVWKI